MRDSTLTVVPEGIGDINSDAKGSGARYNAGKPDLSMLPLTLLARSIAAQQGGPTVTPPVAALMALGRYQRDHDTRWLYQMINTLGHGGWAESAHVFVYGIAKYAPWNWAKGMPWSVPVGSCARHLVAMANGEETDPESLKPHRGHVFCNIVMLLQYAKSYTEGNDLPPKGML